MAPGLAGLILVLVVALNVWATLVTLKDDLAPRAQRIAQIALVWLVPLLGALLTLHFHRGAGEAPTGRYHAVPDAGDDFGVSGQGIRNLQRSIDSGTTTAGESGDGD